MNTHLFMPFSGVSLSHSQSAFSSWEIEINLKKPPIVTGWVIRIQSSIFSGEDTNPRLFNIIGASIIHRIFQKKQKF